MGLVRLVPRFRLSSSPECDGRGGGKITKAALVFLAAVTLAVGARAADWACSPWEWVHPAPTPLRLATVIHWDGGFWGFGPTGVAVSRDGLAWQRRSLVVGRLSSVLARPGELLGTEANTIVASRDGVSWTVRHEVWQDPIFFSIDLRSIASSGSFFVAVGEDYSARFDMSSPVVITSPDGVSWKRATIPAGADSMHSSLSAVIHAGGQFVAVGTYLVSSPDGVSWSTNDSVHGQSLASDGVTFVVAGDELFVSHTLTSWTEVRSPVSGGRVAWASGRFWLAGRCTDCADREPSLWSSPDGESWQRASLDAPIELSAFAASEELLVAVGRGAAASSDGGSWTTGHALLASALTGLASRGNRLVAVGEGGELLVSDDGAAWSRIFWGGHTPLADVVWGPAGFVAVGAGVLLSSPDGEVWASRATPDGGDLVKIVSDGERYVTVGSDKRMFASADGVDWNPVDLTPIVPGLLLFHDLKAGGGTFVASVWKKSGGGAVVASGDGLTWQKGLDTRTGLPDLAWGGGRFLATDFAKVLASSNGTEWQEVSSSLELQAPVWAGDRFVAWGKTSGRFYSSADGADWEESEGPLEGAGINIDSVLWKVDGDGTIRRAVCADRATLADLPSLAHLQGDAGTLWRSDIEVHNGGDGPVTVGLAGTVRNQTAVSAQAAFTLPAGRALRLEDVLASWLGIEDAATVRVSSWGGPPLVLARTYNDTPHGTYGQLVTPFRPASGTEAGGEIRLVGLSSSADGGAGFRTNLGLVNIGTMDDTVEVELWRADGVSLGSQQVGVRAGESVQLHDVFRTVTTVDAPDAYAVIRPRAPGARIHAYASVIDNLSGDPILIRPARSFGNGQSAWLPGSGHLAGRVGSLWRTDVTLHNPGASSATCRIDLFPRDQQGGPTKTASVTVSAGSSVRLGDIVWRQFGCQGGASLRLTATAGEVMAAARTYAWGPAGTHGQLVPALDEDEAITTAAPGRLVMLRQSVSARDGFRSNLGLVNTTAQPAEVAIALHDADGTPLGTLASTLRPYESIQLTEVLRLLTGLPVEDAYAVVRATSPGARVLAYACLIDNRSNDPVFMPAACPQP